MNQTAKPGPRKTIAVVVPAFEDMGGVAAVAGFVLRAIARRPDLEVRLISLAMWGADPASLLLTRPSTWARGPLTAKGSGHGYDFIHVGARFGELEFQRLAPRPQLARLLQGCDLIQVIAGAPSWAMPVVGHGVPVVVQTATLTAVERRMRTGVETGALALWRACMTRLVARIDEQALRRVDAVVVENPWMLDYCRAAAEGLPTRVVYGPPGVDTAVFRPLRPEEPRAARPYLLVVGRLADPRKNAMLLLDAYARLVRAQPDAPDLILAGADLPDERFWSRAGTLSLADRIRTSLLPSLEALASLYRQALCLVLPSDEEGFGVVVIEAMASAVPVVSTRCGGPDGIITDGVDGFLVARDDAAALAERIGRLVRDPAAAAEMGRRALATVQARYSDSAAGDVYLDLYDSLLGAAKP